MEKKTFAYMSILHIIFKPLFFIGFIFIILFVTACSTEYNNNDKIVPQYEVRFVNYDDTLLFTTNVYENNKAIYSGDIPSKPDNNVEEYEFIGWDTNCDNITKDLTVKALFKTIIKTINLDNIEITVDNLAIYTNETIQLELLLYPNNATDQRIEWTSSDPLIVSVNEEGLVNALNVGTATITATAKVNGVQSSCEVTVSNPPIDVTEIVISGQSSFELTTNDFAFISYTIYPIDATDKKLTFESSNDSVVTISESGYMKAVYPGYATITIRAHNGVSTEVFVNVYPRIESIYLDYESATLSNGQSLYLNASINPYDVKDSKLNWSSSNPSVATVDNYGYVVAKSSGTTIIKVSANANSAIYKTCIITVSNADSISFYTTNLPTKIGNGDAYITDVSYKASDSGSSLSVRFTISGYVTRNVQGLAFILVIKDSSGATVVRSNYLDFITVRQSNESFNVTMTKTLNSGYYQISIEPYYFPW